MAATPPYHQPRRRLLQWVEISAHGTLALNGHDESDLVFSPATRPAIRSEGACCRTALARLGCNGIHLLAKVFHPPERLKRQRPCGLAKRSVDNVIGFVGLLTHMAKQIGVRRLRQASGAG